MSGGRPIAFDGVMNANSVLAHDLGPVRTAAGGPALVEVRDLTRIWGKGDAAQVGVVGVDLDVRRGELLAIIGPSGSGKSTLGALLAGIDVPTRGSIVVDGVRIDHMKPDRLAAWRGGHVGIVFQDFHLLPTLTARENVELALELAGHGRRGRRRQAEATLERVGLAAHARKLPAQMSGGEQQRVGIARALVTQPPLLVADEPTGALDQANGHVVHGLLAGLAATGTTVVFITHDLELAATADRIVHMVDGRVAEITVEAEA
jgi:putative ABC transport system ATP-binding protein